VVELLDRFTYEGDSPPVASSTGIVNENRVLYRLLAETLARLAATGANTAGASTTGAPAEERGGLDQVVRFYEMRLLDQVGFRPELFHCLGCEEAIKPQDQYFSAERGGVLCPKCGPQVPEARPVTMNVLRYMRHFQRSSWSEAARAPLPAELNAELEMILHYYLTYILERGLNTPRFLRRLRIQADSS
jgi:DNA repair protein RecO (recombination protein O)